MPIIRPKKPLDQKTLIESSIAYNEKLAKKEKREAALKRRDENNALHEYSKILEAQSKKSRIQSRYANFSENVKINLLAETVSDIASSAMKKVNERLGKTIFENQDMYGTLNAITYQFIRENGSASGILYNMVNGPTTMYLESLAKLIKDTQRAVLEDLSANLDNNGEGKFQMSKNMHDDFVAKSKELYGRNELVDSIADRVADSINDFVQQNAEDKEKIVGALTATKEKIDSMKGASEELKESYARLGRRYVTDVRERKHGLLNEMVVAMSKGVMKNDALRSEFTEDAHLNVGKIVTKVSTMYTFLETVNSMRLIKVNEDYIKDVLNSLENE